MIVQDLNIREIGWNVKIYYRPEVDNMNTILSNLFEIGCKGRNFRRACSLLKSGAFNCGLTYSNPEERSSVVVIGKATNIGELLNTLTHEINHLIEHIMEYLGIDDGSEEEAYFTGEMYEYLYRDALSHVAPFL